MTHLTGETLARLIDEAPDEEEAAHLLACSECAAERTAMIEQTHALSAMGSLAPPAGGWEALQGALRSEGLIRTERRDAQWVRPSLRAAAVLLVLLGGGALLTLRGPGAPADEQVAVRQEPSPAVPRPLPGQERLSVVAPEESEPLPTPVRPSLPVSAGPQRMAADRGARLASSAPIDVSPEPGSQPFSEQDAAALEALVSYVRASAEVDADPVVRLATWQGAVLTTGQAVEQAPASAVANGYHLLAVQQRDAVLRQVSNEQEPWY